MAGSLSFNPLAIPHIVLGLGLIALALFAVLSRGNAIIRVGLLMVFLSAFPYAAGMTLNMTTSDPEVAHLASKSFVGAVALIGPSLMFLFLAMAGRLERYRWLVVLAFGIASVFSVLTWFTDLAIERESWITPLGFFFHEAKPFDSPVVMQLVIWAVVGLWLSQRAGGAPQSERQAKLAKRFVLIGILAATGATDALLANKIGFYPFGVVPALGAVGLALVAVVKHDLLRSRGFDRAGAIELGILVVSAGCALAIVWALEDMGVDRSPWLVAALIMPVILVAQAAMLLVRRGHSERAGDTPMVTELESYVDFSGRIASEAELVEPLEALIRGKGGLPDGRLLVVGEDGALRGLGGEGPGIEVDSRLRPWLIADPQVLVVDELPTMRLGGLRQPVEGFMHRLEATVAAPLVDRGQLVGFIVGAPEGDRALLEAELLVLEQASAATAKAMTYVSLLREATERIEVAKEVEVASAVQEARTAGEQRLRFADCEIAGYYQPAPQFGGHWWSAHELADGRFLVVIGDVTGSGVPAALVSFTAEGACETAQRMYGAGLEVISLLETLDAALRSVGPDHSMSCFAAIFDPESRTVTFANAGHPFPYVCRARGDEVELRSLVSRGTMLGAGELMVRASTFELEAEDLVVFFSDSLVAGRSPDGVSYGDRRLQRLLRSKVVQARDEATRIILDDALEFWGARELEDDLNLVVVRMGVYG